MMSLWQLGDTDSISANSKITLNGVKVTIEELYRLFKNQPVITNYGKISDMFIGKVRTVKLVNKKTGKIELIKTIDNKLLVCRNGELIEIEINDLLKTDKVVKYE